MIGLCFWLYCLISVQALDEGFVTFLAGSQVKLWSKLQDPQFSLELIMSVLLIIFTTPFICQNIQHLNLLKAP